MEREQGAQHSEADEDEGEEHLLDVDGNAVVGGNGRQFEGIGAAVEAVEEVDAQQAENEQRGASHQHEGELHG